jgi:hypothetical protein
MRIEPDHWSRARLRVRLFSLNQGVVVMMRKFIWLGMILIAVVLSTGCGGDEKGANVNKEKPQPASK